MLDALHVLKHALLEGRLMFRDRAALESHQERQIRQHLRWVALHSPATARRFQRAGLTLGRWRELPPTGKAEMMADFDTLNTAGLRLSEALRVARQAEDSRDFTPTLAGTRGPVTVGLSTGTSGNQGVFVASRAERVQWAGVVLRHLLPDWPLGLLRGHRIAFFLRAEGGLYRTVQSRALDFRFFDLLRPVQELAAQLTEYAPTVLVGPPSVLRAVAQAGAKAAPQRVVSVAEVLEDAERDLLTRKFGPLVQVYQATEGLLALPCPHGHLHLNEAHVHFDWEPLGGGYVRPVVTDFRRTTQPIIRHRLDDVLLLGNPCSCGLASRRVERIAGRQDDALLLPGPSGSITVWPDFLRGALGRVPLLQEYQLQQTGPESLRLSLHPLHPEVAEQAVQELRLALTRTGVSVNTLQIDVQPWTAPAPGVKRRRVQRLFRGETQ
ncbi:F390 synthetase-related protein [Deinococcus fonticola]|uniref:F390 synthetase-related protein n=1 Tax=Deinococcus fonticola TaxID=2528713 RepID=UPI001F10EE4B|nr:F390 synthetase-related protein [Deinococcus fonticola]